VVVALGLRPQERSRAFADVITWHCLQNRDAWSERGWELRWFVGNERHWMSMRYAIEKFVGGFLVFFSMAIRIHRMESGVWVMSMVCSAERMMMSCGERLVLRLALILRLRDASRCIFANLTAGLQAAEAIIKNTTISAVHGYKRKKEKI
jgi:hypothetical protein